MYLIDGTKGSITDHRNVINWWKNHMNRIDWRPRCFQLIVQWRKYKTWQNPIIQQKTKYEENGRLMTEIHSTDNRRVTKYNRPTTVSKGLESQQTNENTFNWWESDVNVAEWWMIDRQLTIEWREYDRQVTSVYSWCSREGKMTTNIEHGRKTRIWQTRQNILSFTLR